MYGMCTSGVFDGVSSECSCTSFNTTVQDDEQGCVIKFQQWSGEEQEQDGFERNCSLCGRDISCKINSGTVSSQSYTSRHQKRSMSIGGSQDCEFPLFRQKFWGAAAWTEKLLPKSQFDIQQTDSQNKQTKYLSSQQQHFRGKQIPQFQLDLANLQRCDDEDGGPLTEVGARQMKFALYKNECSQVSQDLFVSAEGVSRDLEILQKNDITHIINCVGYEFVNHFPNDMQYLTLYLYDSPQEDIKCVLYDCFDFIEEARAKKGRVLAHCSQGVSRSAAIVIGYLMWKLDRNYQSVFNDVKSIRGIANPNVGFFTQLMQLYKRWNQPIEKGGCRAYRLAPHCPADATRLVPRLLNSNFSQNSQIQLNLARLDPRSACVFQCADVLYIWQGSDATEEFVLAAKKFADQLVKYEDAAENKVRVFQGLEPADLINVLTSGSQQEAASPPTDDDNDDDEHDIDYNFDQEFEWYQQAKMKQAQDLFLINNQNTSKNYRFGNRYDKKEFKSVHSSVRRGDSALSKLGSVQESSLFSPRITHRSSSMGYDSG